MSTAIVTGTFRKPDDTPLVNATVCFRLIPTGSEPVGNIMYNSSEIEVKTDSNGQISVELWVNGGGTTETRYRITLPDLFGFEATIPSSFGAIDIQELFQQAC